MFAAGDLVAGKFQIDRVIGRGGMGVVVAATHVHLGQRVALKFLLPEVSHDRSVVERFLREARASAQLRSEHICRVSDVGMLDNAPYFVMELLEGRDLASMLAAHGPFPAAIAADYVVQACLGLAEAHAAQIIHRDLKPANLFVTQRTDGVPLIKVVDFGIAKAATGTDFQLTRTDAVMGSPGYMSPEQLRSSRAADARSDIWALGAILFELTTGRQPFTAESLTELALRIGMDPTPVLHGPSIPAGFDRVVYRCLEKDPARRFQDVAQLASALAPFGGAATRDRALGVTRVLSGPQGTSPPPPPSVDHASTTLGASAVGLASASRDRRRRGIVRGAITAGAIAVCAIVAIAVVAVHRDPGVTEPHVTATTAPSAPSVPAASATPAAAPSLSEPPPPPAPSQAAPALSPAPPARSTTDALPPAAQAPLRTSPSASESASLRSTAPLRVPSPAAAPSPPGRHPSTSSPSPAPSPTPSSQADTAAPSPASSWTPSPPPRSPPPPSPAPPQRGSSAFSASPSSALPSRSSSSGISSSPAESLPSDSAHPPLPPSSTPSGPSSSAPARPSTASGEPAGSGHAGSGSPAHTGGGVHRDGDSRRNPAPPARRPAPPHPSPAAGSDDDVGASRR